LGTPAHDNLCNPYGQLNTIHLAIVGACHIRKTCNNQRPCRAPAVAMVGLHHHLEALPHMHMSGHDDDDIHSSLGIANPDNTIARLSLGCAWRLLDSEF
jgi:hypothetical protein